MVEPWGSVRIRSPQGRWVLFATILGTGMVFLDGTVVNVALPSLGRDLDAGLSGLQWVINAYTLTLAALILLGGSLGDRLGRRRVFVFGLVWFAVASLLCGLAPNVPFLVAARALEGVGGALLTPGSLALIQASFDREDRARAIGTWSGFAGITTALGPLLGGWLVDAVSWRWVFLINLPLAVIVLLVAVRHVPESHDPTVTGRFDVLGAACCAAGLAGITYALIEAPNDGATGPVVVAAVAGCAAAVAFVVVEQRSSHPMLPLGIFRSAQFTAANLVTFTVYAAFGGQAFFLIVQLQVVGGFSALAAGSAFLPITLLMLLLSPHAGTLAQRIGPRRPMTLGPLVMAAGLVLLSRAGPGVSYAADVLPGVLLFGLGLAATVAPLTATVLGSAPQEHAGLASGVNNAVARAGGLLAVAVLPLAVGLSGEEYQDPAAFSGPYRAAMLICAGLLALGGVLAWWKVRDDVLVQPDVTAVDARVATCHPEPVCRVASTVGAPPLDPGMPGRPREVA
ncbi:MAG: MFS transporter [Actinomycetes bacterium]